MNKCYKNRAAQYVLGIAVMSVLSLAGCRKDSTVGTTLVNTNTASAGSNAEEVSFRPTVARGAFVANEVLVKFRRGTTESARLRAFGNVRGEVAEAILTKTMERFGDGQALYVLHIPIATEQAMAQLRGIAEVEYAEPNYVYSYAATSNDTYFTNGSLWGMYGPSTSPANQYGSQAAAAWANGNTGSNTVYVGIVDEGVMNTHDDLAANCWVNPYEIAGNGIDDDGNGYKDDVYGWNFVNNNNVTFDKNDDHGTHVAGTIGAVGGNGKGVAGVCWNVKMISTKFLGKSGGTTANAVKAVDYITDLKTRHDMRIVATNNSWGGGGYSQSLKDAIDRADAADILFIAAAGNSSSNNDAVASYPSNYTSANVIAVASITSAGGLSSFSNYGATQVDIGAPGSGINSTIPKTVGKTLTSGYASYNGTSMATPHVTGAAALYAAKNTTATAVDIKNAILTSATPTASLNGKCTTGGRLNVSGF